MQKWYFGQKRQQKTHNLRYIAKFYQKLYVPSKFINLPLVGFHPTGRCHPLFSLSTRHVGGAEGLPVFYDDSALFIWICVDKNAAIIVKSWILQMIIMSWINVSTTRGGRGTWHFFSVKWRHHSPAPSPPPPPKTPHTAFSSSTTHTFYLVLESPPWSQDGA